MLRSPVFRAIKCGIFALAAPPPVTSGSCGMTGSPMAVKQPRLSDAKCGQRDQGLLGELGDRLSGERPHFDKRASKGWPGPAGLDCDNERRLVR